MVSPAQRRAAVRGAQAAFQVSERRACRGLVIHRAMIRYQSVTPDDAPVRRRLHELAKDRPAFGVKRLHTMLRRDGLVINLKKGAAVVPRGTASAQATSAAATVGDRPTATGRGRWTERALGDGLHA